jgi:hypothetical protein
VQWVGPPLCIALRWPYHRYLQNGVLATSKPLFVGGACLHALLPQNQKIVTVHASIVSTGVCVLTFGCTFLLAC